MKSPAGARRADAMVSFLLGLEKAGHQPLVAQVSGTIMLELTDSRPDDHWLIRMDRGNITVANRPGSADVVVRMSKALFTSAVLGRSNLWTAVMRNDVSVEGDLHLLMIFQRLMPGPPNGANPSTDADGDR